MGQPVVHFEQAYLDRIESLGGKTIAPPIPDTGSFALFSDPAGNRIGLFKTA